MPANQPSGPWWGGPAALLSAAELFFLNFAFIPVMFTTRDVEPKGAVHVT